MNECMRIGARAIIVYALSIAALLSSVPSEARIMRIEINRVESPTFEGAVFGDVGQYEKLVGRAFGEIDPGDFQSRKITDIEFAPRNANGMVEYSTDIMILRPVDPARGNHRLFYELTNRGTVLSLAVMNDAPIANDPTAAAHAGNGILMREGYTILLSGWDPTAPPGGGRFQTDVPIAKNPDGSSIVGPSLEEFVIDNSTTVTARLTYPAAVLDTTQATLTKRRRYADTPEPIPASGWEYPSNQSIRLLPAGTAFEQGMLYELVYPAADPLVVGLSFALARDLPSFLRDAKVDDAGNANPLAQRIKHNYVFTVSQPARFIRDFLHLGFNRIGHRRQALDGVLNWIGGPSGGFFNFRFAQPARTHRQHIGRWFPEREFPFANRVLFDPVTKQFDGRLARCALTGTCPKIFEVNSANEYWVKGGSLLHTDTRGRDLRDPRDVRHYFFASFPHQRTPNPICQQPTNPLGGGIGLRALLVALDDWVSHGKRPPKSRVPQRRDGTLVPSLPQKKAGFPDIPGVKYTGLMTTGDLLDFGPQFEDGILTTLPPVVTSPYPVFVPKTDKDGNDIAGIRFPDIEVPVATYTGWALRAEPFGGDDLCDGFGQRIPFANTKAERLATGDPRPSLEERYRSHEDYVKKVAKAAHKLERQRLLLEEDVERVIEAAEASDVGK